MHPKQQIKKIIRDLTGEEAEIKPSPVADFGTPIAFKLAPELKKAPKVIADELAEKLKQNLPESVSSVEATNGYINFYLNYKNLSKNIIREVHEKKEDFGKLKNKNLKIILEHTSVNPSGPVHIGRLRNSLIGDSLSRILKFAGYEVETHYYVNDIGKQIAIIAGGFIEGIGPDQEAVERYGKYKDKDDFLVFFEYVSANREFENNPVFGEMVQDLIKRAESCDGDAKNKITGVAKKCLSGQNEIFKKLNINFDFFDFESEYNTDEVIEFLKNNEHAEIIDGCVALNLESFGLKKKGGGSVLARDDGTSVYLARDIAYHLEKIKLGDRIINVLGEDHKLEFMELKTILTEFYKIEKPIDAVHFSFVSFEGEKLSTRRGQTAPVDKLIDDAVLKARQEIEARGIAGIDAAQIIGIGAMKYHIIKREPQKPITFRWDEALNFDGETAPYIQYAHARCCRILEKANFRVDEINIDALFSDGFELEKEEKNLIKIISEFEDVVERASGELKPNLIAIYVYEIASQFSKFYKECKVIGTDENVEKRRLLMVDAARQVIKNGLGLIGIESPERM